MKPSLSAVLLLNTVCRKWTMVMPPECTKTLITLVGMRSGPGCSKLIKLTKD